MATPTCHRCGAPKDKATGNCKSKSCFYRETCSACGRLGHSADRCPLEFRKRQAERDERAAMRLRKQREFEAKLANMTCFKCGEKGHDRSRCPKLAPTSCVYVEPRCNNTSEEMKNQSSQLVTQDSSVDADVETSLPENADIASPLDLIDDSVGDEMSDSSKSENSASENMVASLMVASDEVALADVTASTFEQAEFDDVNAWKDKLGDSWNLEEVLSRAPWKPWNRS